LPAPQPNNGPSAASSVLLNRSQRVAVAAMATVLLVCCAVLAISRRGEPIAAPAAGGSGASYQVDLNRAEWYELSLLPGLGEVLSKRIVAYRGERGAFKSVDEIVGVEGIGAVKLEQLRPYLVVGGPRSQ